MEERLAVLQQKQVELNAKILRIKTQDLSKKNKQDTRLKLLIGTAMLAEINTLKEMLNHYIYRKSDREFLSSFGFLDEPAD